MKLNQNASNFYLECHNIIHIIQIVTILNKSPQNPIVGWWVLMLSLQNPSWSQGLSRGP